MKRLLTLLIIMLLLGGIAYYIHNSQENKGPAQSASYDFSDREFAVKDIDNIGKIEIQKAYQDGTVLDKRNGVWYVNGKYEANKAAVEYLLNTIKGVEIQNIPPRSSVPNIVKELERSGLHVSIYDTKGNLMKGYTIGSLAYDEMGTSFLLDGKQQPYNLFLKGFEGRLRERYSNTEEQWRSKKVRTGKPDQIEKVTMEYPKKQSQSFVLDNSTATPSVTTLSKFVKKGEKEINPDKVRAYLSEFNNLYAEGFENEYFFKDSITQLIPFATLTLEEKDKDPKVIDFYSYYEMNNPTADIDNTNPALLVERYYANVRDEDFLLVQGKLFKGIFRPYDYFVK